MMRCLLCLFILLPSLVHAAGEIPVARTRSMVPITLNNADNEFAAPPAPPVRRPLPEPEPAPPAPAPAPLPEPLSEPAPAAPPVSAAPTDPEEQYAYCVEQVLAQPQDAERNFRLGLAAQAVGRYPQAVLAFERTLALEPRSDRARLELGRTYLAMGQRARAEEYFAEVRAHEPPAAVEANIDRLLAQEAQQRSAWQLHGSVEAGVFYDDNTNAGLSSSQVTLNNITYTMSDGVARPDHGMTGEVTLTATRPLPDAPWEFVAGAIAYQKYHFDEDRANLRYLRGQAGVRYPARDWALQVLAKGEYVGLNEDALVGIMGFEPALVLQLQPGVQSVSAATLEHRDHHVTGPRTGNYYALGETLHWQFLPGHTGRFGARAFREYAGDERYENHGWEAQAGVTVTLPQAAGTLDGSMQRRVTHYDAPSNNAVSNCRDDGQFDYALTWRRDLPWWEGFGVECAYRLTMNNSNTDLHDYRRTVYNMAVNYTF